MLLAFLGVSLLVIVTPGPDTALLIRNVVAGGRSRGIATAAGVATGQVLWALATAGGLSAVLATSTVLFEALRLAGAAYLIVLGLLTLRQVWKGEPAATPGGRLSGPSLRMAYGMGLVSNLSNPKMAMFFPSLLPQFVPLEAPAFATSFGLGALFAAMAFGWLVVISLFLDSQAARSVPGRLRRWLGGATGVALVGFGLHFALGRR